MSHDPRAPCDKQEGECRLDRAVQRRCTRIDVALHTRAERHASASMSLRIRARCDIRAFACRSTSAGTDASPQANVAARPCAVRHARRHSLLGFEVLGVCLEILPRKRARARARTRIETAKLSMRVAIGCAMLWMRIWAPYSSQLCANLMSIDTTRTSMSLPVLCPRSSSNVRRKQTSSRAADSVADATCRQVVASLVRLGMFAGTFG